MEFRLEISLNIITKVQRYGTFIIAEHKYRFNSSILLLVRIVWLRGRTHCASYQGGKFFTHRIAHAFPALSPAGAGAAMPLHRKRARIASARARRQANLNSTKFKINPMRERPQPILHTPMSKSQTLHQYHCSKRWHDQHVRLIHDYEILLKLQKFISQRPSKYVEVLVFEQNYTEDILNLLYIYRKMEVGVVWNRLR